MLTFVVVVVVAAVVMLMCFWCVHFLSGINLLLLMGQDYVHKPAAEPHEEQVTKIGPRLDEQVGHGGAWWGEPMRR